MPPTARTATVFGATGFVGRAVVRALARAGWRVKAAVRRPESAYFLAPLGTPGQIAAVPFSACDRASVEGAAASADLVVNAVGILAERRRGDFVRLHADLAGAIARAARGAGARSLVHVSALGIAGAPSLYAESKLWGEAAVQAEFAGAAILRPSVVFGAERMGFFGLLDRLSALLPALPLIGGGHTRFQPVCADDVGAAALAAAGKPGTYALGGPKVVTFRECAQRLLAITGRRRALVPVPWALAKAQGTVLQHLPGRLLTADQVDQLRADAVVPEGTPDLTDLDIAPTPMEIVLPVTFSRTPR